MSSDATEPCARLTEFLNGLCPISLKCARLASNGPQFEGSIVKFTCVGNMCCPVIALAHDDDPTSVYTLDDASRIFDVRHSYYVGVPNICRIDAWHMRISLEQSVDSAFRKVCKVQTKNIHVGDIIPIYFRKKKKNTDASVMNAFVDALISSIPEEEMLTRDVVYTYDADQHLRRCDRHESDLDDDYDDYDGDYEEHDHKRRRIAPAVVQQPAPSPSDFFDGRVAPALSELLALAYAKGITMGDLEVMIDQFFYPQSLQNVDDTMDSPVNDPPPPPSPSFTCRSMSPSSFLL